MSNTDFAYRHIAFHLASVPLPKWLAALYLMAMDKGGISVLRLSRLIGVNAMCIFTQRHLSGAAITLSNALPTLSSLVKRNTHDASITPHEQAMERLPSVHLIIANLKRFLLGIFHGVSRRYLFEYADAAIYRFSQRHLGGQVPHRLSETVVAHPPIQS